MLRRPARGVLPVARGGRAAWRGAHRRAHTGRRTEAPARTAHLVCTSRLLQSAIGHIERLPSTRRRPRSMRRGRKLRGLRGGGGVAGKRGRWSAVTCGGTPTRGGRAGKGGTVGAKPILLFSRHTWRGALSPTARMWPRRRLAARRRAAIRRRRALARGGQRPWALVHIRGHRRPYACWAAVGRAMSGTHRRGSRRARLHRERWGELRLDGL